MDVGYCVDLLCMTIEQQKALPTRQLLRLGSLAAEEVNELEPDQVFRVGDVLADRYEVKAKIGSGGMGQVFRVVDRTLLGEVLALKLLSPNLAKERQYFQRFRNEVILARRLSHPHIVRIFDFGDLGHGYHYISMDFVAGADLRTVIENAPGGKLSLEAALQILFQTSLALDYAHQIGVIHRDLKPDNLLLSANGDIKLSDFGSARLLRVEKGITATGELVGTPHYMAPELFRGERPTPQVDIYSLGILLYEMVTGKLPFSDESVLGIITKHLNHPLPSAALSCPDLPSWFQDILENCTDKDPRHRFKTAGQVAHIACVKLLEMGKDPKTACVPNELAFGTFTPPRSKSRRGFFGR